MAVMRTLEGIVIKLQYDYVIKNNHLGGMCACVCSCMLFTVNTVHTVQGIMEDIESHQHDLL